MTVGAALVRRILRMPAVPGSVPARGVTCLDPRREKPHTCPGRCSCYTNHLCRPGCTCTSCGTASHEVPPTHQVSEFYKIEDEKARTAVLMRLGQLRALLEKPR